MFSKTIIALLLATTANLACNATGLIVVPNDLADVEGNSASIDPFTGGPPWNSNPSKRLQQVYDASQFAAMDPEGEFIVEVEFRMDTDQGPGFGSSIHLSDVQVNLSTTQKTPDNLRAVFANNVGADDKVVFDRGELQFTGAYSPSSRPQPFSALISFKSPFFYRPSLGNLLLDVRIFTYSNSLGSMALDYSDVTNDSVSTLWSSNVMSAAGVPLTRGLVSRFAMYSRQQLNVVRTNTNVEFSWLDLPMGYRLETTTTLGPTSNWQLVSAPVLTNYGTDLKVILPLNTNIQGSFYRLIYRPPP